MTGSNFRKWLDAAIWVFGILSFLSLIAFFLALTDIWHDYASPDVFARAGQSLPDWYSQFNRCLLEWRFLQVGFVLMLVFHILLIVRWLSGRRGQKRCRNLINCDRSLEASSFPPLARFLNLF